ncbi:plasmid transfer protein TraA [Pseudonocardia acaciae]|uniref:plasmid transfer protein TraA n=1 Tax=Pseudonocardia acaciae TaxID=551276 RepID=UPI0012EE1A44|nr:plasmid transfer protein TraA [Pseudonocardia acaciae]
MAEQQRLGEPEFFSPRMIREYCERARNFVRPLFHELHVSAEELEMVLRELPSSNPHVFGQDSKVRARLVANHMRRAADGAEVTAASLVRTYLSFRKHYMPEIHQRGQRTRRKFDINDQ